MWKKAVVDWISSKYYDGNLPGSTENERLSRLSVSMLSLEPGFSRTQTKSVGDCAYLLC